MTAADFYIIYKILERRSFSIESGVLTQKEEIERDNVATYLHNKTAAVYYCFHNVVRAYGQKNINKLGIQTYFTTL